jgi:hypothetical protein
MYNVSLRNIAINYDPSQSPGSCQQVSVILCPSIYSLPWEGWVVYWQGGVYTCDKACNAY